MKKKGQRLSGTMRRIVESDLEGLNNTLTTMQQIKILYRKASPSS